MHHGGRKDGLRQALCFQVTQLTKMMDSLLEGEIEDLDLLECFFLEALYCSLGSSLLEPGRIRFDECIKRLSSMPTAETEGIWARPGELPGRNRGSSLGCSFIEEMNSLPSCLPGWVGGLGDITTCCIQDFKGVAHSSRPTPRSHC